MDALDERLRRKRVLRDRMDQASSYQQWRELAGNLEELEAHEEKHQACHRIHFDEALLKEKVAALKLLTNSQTNPRDLMFSLRMDLVRNIANIAKNGLNEQVRKIQSTNSMCNV